jgi:hypothetical protein
MKKIPGRVLLPLIASCYKAPFKMPRSFFTRRCNRPRITVPNDTASTRFDLTLSTGRVCRYCWTEAQHQGAFAVTSRRVEPLNE